MSTTADAPSTRRYKNCLAVSQMIGVAVAGKNAMRASAAGTRREQRRTDENSGTAKTAMRRASSITVTGSHGTYLLPGLFPPGRYPCSANFFLSASFSVATYSWGCGYGRISCDCGSDLPPEPRQLRRLFSHCTGRRGMRVAELEEERWGWNRWPEVISSHGT